VKAQHKIRGHILKKVKEFFKAAHKEKFIPGKSRIPYSGRVYDDKELINLVDASLDFWLTCGRFAARFEKRLAHLLRASHCLLVNSGSSANLLAVCALASAKLKQRRLKPGDEVITTACGFPTTLNPIIQSNLIPVFVDIDIGTYNIKAQDIERAITKKTKAIFIAHTLGNPANIDLILKVAKRYNLWFIEDNCDALGSKYKGRFTGTFGDISTCSFYPAHHITMGEGGAVLTNDSILKKIAMSLRDWGRDCWCDTGHDNTCGKRFSQKFGSLPLGYDHKYVYSHIGYNLKVTDMQAAVGLAQLDKLNSFIAARKKNFNILFEIFKKFDRYFMLPLVMPDSDPSWFGFPLLVKEGSPFSRKDIVLHLENNKIATRMLFAGNLIKQPAYQGMRCRIAGNLKNTDLVMNNLFWLGVYQGLGKAQFGYINKIVNDFFKKQGIK
jgi:CDP-6-deoxy-D-xylo-4-hexulose-3-dehydrase